MPRTGKPAVGAGGFRLTNPRARANLAAAPPSCRLARFGDAEFHYRIGRKGRRTFGRGHRGIRERATHKGIVKYDLTPVFPSQCREKQSHIHKYIIMGVQGCGKGTQAKLLKEALDLVHISVGDIFRWHIQSRTKLGARIKRIMAEGQLVPDDVVEEVVKQRLEQHDWNYGFILDGFPRNARQAAFFLESYDIDAVLLIEVPDAVVQERILNRRLCPKCGLDYNLIFHRPAVANTCDVCGAELIARPDDTPEAVHARLQDFHTKTQPILELFRRKELVVVVDGTPSTAEVQQDLRRQLGQRA
jgi:adenylate kinase